MRTHVALLRGINVGGNQLVKMADLKAFLESLGYEDVKTLLQSGNVAFSASGGSDAVEAELIREAPAKLGVKCDWFVRSAAEWGALVEANPFPEEARQDPAHLLAILVHDEVDAARVAAVQRAIKGHERIAAGDRVVYAVYPDGVGPSKVGQTPGWGKLVGVGTGRNWNTVLKLNDLLSDPSPLRGG